VAHQVVSVIVSMSKHKRIVVVSIAHKLVIGTFSDMNNALECNSTKHCTAVSTVCCVLPKHCYSTNTLTEPETHQLGMSDGYVIARA
jgi:hypothetical protein